MTRDWETTLALVFPVSCILFHRDLDKRHGSIGREDGLVPLRGSRCIPDVEGTLEGGFGSSEFLGDDGVVGMADDENAAVAHGLGCGQPWGAYR